MNGEAAARRPKIVYVVHDLGDAAVARRTAMLRAAGADVMVAGFRRTDAAPAAVAGALAIDLGRTHDARLAQRLLAVVRRVAAPGAVGKAARDADAVFARNLESLAVAAQIRPAGARLIYECLDIHRTLIGRSPAHRLIQQVHAALLRRIDGLIVSSPAFVREYFASRLPAGVPVTLVENKWLALDAPPPIAPAQPIAGPPWTIGWFGNLRCKRSFAQLATLSASSHGRVEVLIAGRPSPAEFPDFAAVAAAAPGVRYVGPYAPAELPELYARCHFAWAIDYFEEGLNSSWLLPNRLYEAPTFGAVPIALTGVETGRRLKSLGAGLLVADAEQLGPILATMDAAAYAVLAAAVAQIPRDTLIADRSDCDALLKAIAG